MRMAPQMRGHTPGDPSSANLRETARLHASGLHRQSEGMG